MGDELGATLVRRSGALAIRRGASRVAGQAVAVLGTSLAVVVAGVTCTWALSGPLLVSAGALAAWVAALVLVVAVLVLLAHRGRHSAWFHPLSIPFATIAIMSLGAPLWVFFTHQAVGLLYDAGYEPRDASPLAAAVSVTACEALALVVIGYLIGISMALALSKSAESASESKAGSTFRYREMRNAGFILMALGAVSQMAVAILTSGVPYGVNQFQYGLPSILSPGAATALLAGLILVTLTGAHVDKPTRLRNLLRAREWTVLFVYLMAIAFTGQRLGLISPIVFLSWTYSNQVRVIALRGVVATLLAALIAGAAISNYRANDGLSPGSPSEIVQSALGDVSSSAWLTQQTAIRVPYIAHYMHGSTYLAAVEGQLPGPLGRAIGAPTRTASAVFRNIIGFSDPNQGFAESYPSEAYLNFGLIGCLGAGIFLGGLMGWAWRKSSQLATRPREVLYPILLAGLIGGFRSDALTQIKEVLYPILVISILMGWYRLTYWPGDRPLRRMEVVGSRDVMRADRPGAPCNGDGVAE